MGPPLSLLLFGGFGGGTLIEAEPFPVAFKRHDDDGDQGRVDGQRTGWGVVVWERSEARKGAVQERDGVFEVGP